MHSFFNLKPSMQTAIKMKLQRLDVGIRVGKIFVNNNIGFFMSAKEIMTLLTVRKITSQYITLFL